MTAEEMVYNTLVQGSVEAHKGEVFPSEWKDGVYFWPWVVTKVLQT